MENFQDWLSEELEKRGWKPADLARASKLDSAVISNIMNGSRGVGKKTAMAISKALNVPAETVYRAAGLLPNKPEDPPGFAEWVHLFLNADEDQREEMLEYARFKAQQQGQRNKRPI